MTLSGPWLTSLFFIVIRLGTVLLFTPIQALRQLPIMVRLLFVFIIGMLINRSLLPLGSLENTDIVIGGIMEFADGLILAASIAAAFTVFSIGGQIIDSIWGINASAILNPAEHTHEPFMGHLLSMLAVILFFSIDGHLWLFKGLHYSFVAIPPGSLTLFSGYAPIIKQFGFMFSFAFMIASPVILALVIVDLCANVITRTMPQVQSFFLLAPIKLCLGLVVLIMMLDFINPLSTQVFTHCFHTWEEVML